MDFQIKALDQTVQHEKDKKQTLNEAAETPKTSTKSDQNELCELVENHSYDMEDEFSLIEALAHLATASEIHQGRKSVSEGSDKPAALILGLKK